MEEQSVQKFSIFSFALLFLTLPILMARADLLETGKSQYKAGQFTQAAATLENAAKQDPGNAHIWWQLNFVYNKLGRYNDALNAAKQANKLDPSNSFASSPAKYNQIVSRLQAAAGGGSAGNSSSAGSAMTSGSSRSGSGSGTIVQQLLSGDVYVQPGMNVDSGRLQQAADALRPTVVKFVVFNSNSGASKLYAEAERIRHYLNSSAGIGNGYVIVSSRRGVSASSSALSKSRLKAVTAQVAPMMEAGSYTEGLVALAQGLVQARQQAAASSQRTWVIVLVLAAGIILVFIFLGRSSRNETLKAIRMRLEKQKSGIITQLNMLDDDIRVSTNDNLTGARQARVSAGSKLDEAASLLVKGKTEIDLNRVESLLDQAAADIARGRSILNGTPLPPQPAGAGVPPAYPAGKATTDASMDWQSIPENQRGVCFFCSRPSLMSELSPVTVNLNGQQQKVLACPTDMETIRSGQNPQIRAFNVNGQYVPWYASSGYDPYRDYYQRGYNGGSFMTDMITLSVIDNMFWNWNRPMGWGWGGGWGGWGGGYAFYPNHPFYQDYSFNNAAGYSDFSNSGMGGTDFLQSSGGDLGGGDLGQNFGGGMDNMGSDRS
jgi:hypothetical protein